MGAPESARLLSRSPEYWLHHVGHENTLSAALQLQHDVGLILSNVQVLQQFVTALDRTSSEVMGVTIGRRPFPADAMQQVVPSYRVSSGGKLNGSDGLMAATYYSGYTGTSAVCDMQSLHDMHTTVLRTCHSELRWRSWNLILVH